MESFPFGRKYVHVDEEVKEGPFRQKSSINKEAKSSERECFINCEEYIWQIQELESGGEWRWAA